MLSVKNKYEIILPVDGQWYQVVDGKFPMF